MKRFFMIVAVAASLTVSAFAQVVDPLDAVVGDDASAQTPAQRIQRQIIDLYISNFRNDVGLSEEQFLKVSPVLTQFVRNRFQAARSRADLDQQLTRLLSQPNSSEADIQKLTEDRAKVETQAATMETRLVNRLRPDLTARQAALIFQFNKKFNEELRGYVEKARANAAERGQRQRGGAAARPNANGAKEPVVRPNANRAQDPVRPGAALKNKTR